jgi:hypothetical protein
METELRTLEVKGGPTPDRLSCRDCEAVRDHPVRPEKHARGGWNRWRANRIEPMRALTSEWA